MIEFANKQTTLIVRKMWKECFDDTDEFLDIYFEYKYKEENTLIFFVEGVAAASLQMLPYEITFYREKIPFAYLAGLCTLPEYRNKGYMSQLILKAHEILKERNIPLAILVPAEDWLFGFYEKYGYEQVFEEGKEPIAPLKELLDKHSSLETAYMEFNALYSQKDFCVQKSFTDFVAIVKEQVQDKFPPKYNISGMARLINEDYLLNLYARKAKVDPFCIQIQNEGITTIYQIADNTARQTTRTPDIETDIHLLCRLLFGYKTDELREPFRKLFPQHYPIMDLMLE